MVYNRSKPYEQLDDLGVFPLFFGNTHFQVGEFFRAYDSDLKGSSSLNPVKCSGVQLCFRSCFLDVSMVFLGYPNKFKKIYCMGATKYF